jgi:4-hydroxybutyrate dehydrogenase
MTLIRYLTRTHFAEAAIEDALPEVIGSLSRTLVLIDDEPGTEAALQRVQEVLPDTSLEVATCRPQTPRRDLVEPICIELKQADTTTLIAVGGAAAIGQARLAADHAARKGDPIVVIAVPVRLFDLGLARQVRPADSRPLTCPRPDHVIADPTVLELATPRLLAASAMETLVHAMEAYANPSYNPPADGLAVEAIRRMTRWLPVAMHEPDRHDARRELMAAAMTAGMALEKDVGGVDALVLPIKIDLGTTCLPGDLHAPMLAAVAQFNAQAVGERYSFLAGNFGRNDPALTFSSKIGDFTRSIGLPTALREFGVNPDRFDSFAEMAANDPAALANPRRLTPKDCRQILEAAW